jgi:hypothetical protein
MDEAREQTMSTSEWEEEEEDYGYKCRYALYVPILIKKLKEALDFFRES